MISLGALQIRLQSYLRVGFKPPAQCTGDFKFRASRGEQQKLFVLFVTQRSLGIAHGA